ncbi:MAG: pilus assembly protein PilP [Syntrophaceae bacterium]|nr:pilus assembly protein PilP [Syntrophaceae bacterium]
MSIKKRKFMRVLTYGLIFSSVTWGMMIPPLGAEDAVLTTTGKVNLETAGKRDPFKPFIETGSEVRKTQKTKGGLLPISPLQRQDLSAFNLVGISGNDRDGWNAIVEDGEKKFYPIVEGTLIGLEKGRVTSIKSDRVIVAVKPSDQRGKISYITIMLHKDVEGAP